MTIKPLEVTVGEITMGYVNNDEQGVRGYYGKLDIRPPYQREFIYNEKEQQAVIRTVLNGYPLSSMYWVKRSDSQSVSMWQANSRMTSKTSSTSLKTFSAGF